MSTFKEKMKEINEQLQNGTIPDELNFTCKKETLLEDIIDYVKYYAFYKDYLNGSNKIITELDENKNEEQ